MASTWLFSILSKFYLQYTRPNMLQITIGIQYNYASQGNESVSHRSAEQLQVNDQNHRHTLLCIFFLDSMFPQFRLPHFKVLATSKFDYFQYE